MMSSKCMITLITIYSLGISSNAISKKDGELSNPVLIISVDGIRWDFTERLQRLREYNGAAKDRPALLDLIEKSAFARKGIKGIFPTTTYPNQYSMVTGLFAENHGIISDVVYDAQQNRTADVKERDKKDDWVFKGDSIWKTFQQQSPPMKSACYNWTGCYGGDHPDTAINMAIKWLEEEYQLILISLPFDDMIKERGSVENALRLLDDDIRQLFMSMEMKNYTDRINLIIMSGHGMTDIINATALLPEEEPPALFTVRSKTSTMWLVQPNVGYERQTIDYFQKFDHVQVFAKEEIPAEWRYKSNPRVSAMIMVLAEPGYALSNGGGPGGFYGYNNELMDMRGTFIATGPAFVRNSTIPESMRTVDVYPLLCLLLNITPAPNQGLTKEFHHFVQPNYLRRTSGWKTNTSSYPNTDFIAIIILSIILVIGVIVGSCLCYRSGECTRERRMAESNFRSQTAESIISDGKSGLRKYESEILILDLDDPSINVNA